MECQRWTIRREWSNRRRGHRGTPCSIPRLFCRSSSRTPAISCDRHFWPRPTSRARALSRGFRRRFCREIHSGCLGRRRWPSASLAKRRRQRRRWRLLLLGCDFGGVNGFFRSLLIKPATAGKIRMTTSMAASEAATTAVSPRTGRHGPRGRPPHVVGSFFSSRRRSEPWPGRVITVCRLFLDRLHDDRLGIAGHAIRQLGRTGDGLEATSLSSPASVRRVEAGRRSTKPPWCEAGNAQTSTRRKQHGACSGAPGNAESQDVARRRQVGVCDVRLTNQTEI